MISIEITLAIKVLVIISVIKVADYIHEYSGKTEEKKRDVREVSAVAAIYNKSVRPYHHRSFLRGHSFVWLLLLFFSLGISCDIDPNTYGTRRGEPLASPVTVKGERHARVQRGSGQLAQWPYRIG